MKATTTALSSLQKTIGAGNSGLSLTWSVTGTQLSSQSANCNLANLVAQARTQVQQIATAASLMPGALVRLTSSNTVCALTTSFALGAPSSTSSITVTTTDAVPTPPDQAAIYIYITSGPAGSLADISAALTDAGVTGATFAGISQLPLQAAPVDLMDLTWKFTETVPLANLKDTFAQLTTAARTISEGNSGLRLTFGAAGLSFSQLPVCPQAELLSEAKSQAQNVATAAGVNAGPVLSLSAPALATAPAFVAAIFGAVTIYDPLSAPSMPLQTPTCSLTAQFQML